MPRTAARRISYERFCFNRLCCIIILYLLVYTLGVAQDAGEILLEEHFEEKKDSWKVLEKDLGNDFIIAKEALSALLYPIGNSKFRTVAVNLTNAPLVQNSLISYWSFDEDTNQR